MIDPRVNSKKHDIAILDSSHRPRNVIIIIYYHTKIFVVSTTHATDERSVHVIHAAAVVNMSHVRMRNNTLYKHNNIIV